MNEKEAHELLAARLNLEPRLIPFLVELQRDKIILNPLRPASVRRLGRLLDLKPGGRVLDLGCGKAGASLPLVRAYKVNLLGLDLLPEMIREAWARAEAAALYHLCDFVLEDAARFAAQTRGQWDAVLVLGSGSLIWTDLEACLKATLPLVRPGGSLALGEPYYRPGAARQPDKPFLSRDETTARLAREGRVLEIIDDKEEGWEAYYEPEARAKARLRKENPQNRELQALLDGLDQEEAWEKNNLGWAVWVLRLD